MNKVRSARGGLMTPATIQLIRLALDDAPSIAPVPFDQEEVSWILHSGLGPLLWHALEHHPGLVPADQADRVKAANLSAYMLSLETFDHLNEMLSRAANIGCQVTLLKGASVAQQWYPERHWRPMRDIDVLVSARDQPGFEQQLLELGYRQTSDNPASFYIGHQHSAPFFHPLKNCWVEVHTALFRGDTPAGHISAFRPEVLSRVPAEVAGDAPGNVWRLSDELQLVYTAVHWATQLTLAGGVIPILDSLLILRKSRNRLGWDRILEACRNDTAARHLWLMLSYMEKHGLYEIPRDVRHGLENGRRTIGGIGQKMLHRIIDENMAAGCRERLFNSNAMLTVRWDTLLSNGSPARKLMQLPWRMLFPPRETERFYSIRHWQRVKNALSRTLK